MGHAVSQGGADVDEDLCVAPHLPNVHPETVDVADDREHGVTPLPLSTNQPTNQPTNRDASVCPQNASACPHHAHIMLPL